ncbi:TonB-dependent receptor [Marinobacter daepoensis]|uniref:TonB-dependent receptor n=1 Tax=Marinobacter daepoensis TaxID=262077 RepID=A0ABS3BA63_9GAMM|nr:TonB-dependent receptor [Marinobacter daepoensis]MBN7768754.1 TonB-dependent receptor [Marinobacter daepoensis]MBY6079491.1 TonB-dependent receptor [Marinobacter daepoensis]
MKKTALLLSILVAASARAEETLPFIIVESRPLNAATDIDPSQATSPVRVIERREFENRTVNLSEVLSTQTGVQIRQSGGLGSYSSVSLRGSTTRQVQVVVDGMLLNDPVTGGVDMGKLGLHDIARIQVYPGSAPAQFAQAGIGGVVVMETLGKDIEDTTRVNLGAGSFDTYKAGAFKSGSHEDFYYWISLDQQSSNNDFEYPNESDWFNPNDGKTTTRRNADYTQKTVSSKFGWEPSQTRRIDALIQFNDNKQGVPAIQNWRSNKAYLANETLRTQFHYQQQDWLDGQLHSSHRLLFADLNERYNNTTGRVGLGTSDLHTDTRQIGLVNTLSVLLKAHTFSGTLDISHYDYEQNDRLDELETDKRERLQFASALSHQWQSPQHRLRTQATLRYLQVHDDSDESLLGQQRRKLSSETSHFGWQLGANYLLFDDWTISGNISQQTRIPTLEELHGDRGSFNGNDDLKPEESLNYEASLRTERAWGHAEITGFFRDLDPAIVAIYDARGVGTYTNLSAEIYGTELDARYQINQNWSLYGNATLQESKNLGAKIKDRQNKLLPGIYHESYLIGGTWRRGALTFDLEYLFGNNLYYDAANLLEADTKQLFNATISIDRVWPNRSFSTISLEMRNINDEVYQDFNRYPSPGRSWFINISHTF